MKLNLKATVPLVAIIDGAINIDGGNPVVHQHDNKRTARTSVTCTNPHELAAAKSRDDLIGFALPSPIRPSQWAAPVEVTVSVGNAATDKPPVIRVCVFGPDAASWLEKDG